MKNENVINLEARKKELLCLIKEETDKVKQERDALAHCIFEAEAQAKQRKNALQGTPKTDIYSTESILEAGAGEDTEFLNKKINLFYKAYALNPYGDEKKAADIMPLLEELQTVCAQLDTFYNYEIARAAKVVETAQDKLRTAEQQRKQYRCEVLQAQKDIHSTVVHSVIGYNELSKHDADSISANPLFSMGHSAMDGAVIAGMLKSAIESELENASAQRSKQLPTEHTTVPTNTATLDEAPFAFFDTKGNGKTSNRISNFMRRVSDR